MTNNPQGKRSDEILWCSQNLIWDIHQSIEMKINLVTDDGSSILSEKNESQGVFQFIKTQGFPILHNSYKRHNRFKTKSFVLKSHVRELKLNT